MSGSANRLGCRAAIALVLAVFLPDCVALAEDVRFLRDVAPILLQRCAGCHGPKKTEGNYRVHTFEFLMKAGDSGESPVVAGDAAKSQLMSRILDADSSTRMPQEDDPLSADEKSVIRRWIEAGASFDGTDRAAPISSQLPPKVHPPAPVAYSTDVPVYAIAFSPAGDELFVSGYREVTVWNPLTGDLKRRLGGLPQRIQTIVPTRDGRTLLVAGGTPGEYGEVCLVANDGAAPVRVLGTFEDLVLGAAFNPAEDRVVAASADRNVRCWSVADGRLAWSSRLHSDWVTSVAWSPDGKFVATGSRDYTIKVLDGATGELFTTYNGHQKQLGQEKGRFAVFAIAFSADPAVVCSAGEGKSIRVWNPEQAQTENGSAADMEIRFYKAGHTQYLEHQSPLPVFDLAVAGHDMFAAAGNGRIQRFDLTTMKLLKTYEGPGDWMFAVDAHSATGRVAAGGFDGRVRVWNLESGETVATFLASPGRLRMSLR
jgi:hypothetical protein